MVKNIYNNDMPIPTEWGSTQNITEENSWDLLQRLGFRRVPEQPAIADGYVRTSSVLVEGDGEWGVWEVVDRLAADVEAEKLAARKQAIRARITPDLAALASALRATLRALTGLADAEVNHTITEAYVTALILQLPTEQYDAKTADLLKLAFEKLSVLTDDGTTWSLFELIGEDIP